MLEKYEAAIGHFKRALAIAPDYKEAWTNMATAYGRLGNHIEANKGFKKAHDLDPKYKQALVGLIYSHRNMGQFEEAYKYCDEIEPIVGKAEADQHRAAVKERETS